MPVNTQHADELAFLLSDGRIEKLLELTGSPALAIELHQESMNLGATLMGIIGTVEIALRNTVVDNLNSFPGSAGWLHGGFRLLNRPKERRLIRKANESAKRTKYAKLGPQQRDVAGNWQHVTVTDDEVVTALNLNFWKSLFSEEYERTLWRRTLKRTFPYKPLRRADVAKHLEGLYQTRNRLAHHEPVQGDRFREAVEAIEFVCQHLGQSKPNPSTALSTLLADDIAQVCKAEGDFRDRLDSFRSV